MELLRKKLLLKLKRRNRGNIRMVSAIEKLVSDIETASWKKKSDIIMFRPDADCVHGDGFYFFNIHIHRTMILIDFDDNEATVIWAGSHDEYDAIFKGNKDTIEKWLRSRNLV